ncbi:MAG: STAS domain-containing protein [Deltaproteobacteria bacterium]|nr:STAS domain-containing protein [Deltaproteobacteria bacterium]
MEIEQEKRGDVLVVRVLDNRLDAHCADEFREEMAGYVANGDRSIVLNLSRVDFVDSSGLGAIVALFKMMGQGSRLAVCGTKDAVTRLFKLTRMNKVFDMFDTERQAVHAFAQS